MKHNKIIEGNVIYNKRDDYSSVEEIRGYLDCEGADTRGSFPHLTTVGGGLYCEGAYTKGSFPQLTTVGGWLYCSGADTRCSFPQLTTVGGYLDCYGADIRGSFPQLTTVGGYLYCAGADTKSSFPQLTTVGGYLNCRGADIRGSFPKLTTVGGGLDCSETDTKGSFPQLTTVGGYLDCRGADTKGAFPQLTVEHTNTTQARRRVSQAFLDQGFLLSDGILSKIVFTRTSGGVRIHKVVTVGQINETYCIEQDGVFSHGDTLKEARESFVYKVSDRDKSKYSEWTVETKITRKEAIESYRVITGACEAGTRNFVETHAGTDKDEFTVGEVIELTKGQFGNEEYMGFFKKQ